MKKIKKEKFLSEGECSNSTMLYLTSEKMHRIHICSHELSKVNESFMQCQTYVVVVVMVMCGANEIRLVAIPDTVRLRQT